MENLNLFEVENAFFMNHPHRAWACFQLGSFSQPGPQSRTCAKAKCPTLEISLLRLPALHLQPLFAILQPRARRAAQHSKIMQPAIAITKNAPINVHWIIMYMKDMRMRKGSQVEARTNSTDNELQTRNKKKKLKLLSRFTSSKNEPRKSEQVNKQKHNACTAKEATRSGSLGQGARRFNFLITRVPNKRDQSVNRVQ